MSLHESIARQITLEIIKSLIIEVGSRYLESQKRAFRRNLSGKNSKQKREGAEWKVIYVI